MLRLCLPSEPDLEREMMSRSKVLLQTRENSSWNLIIQEIGLGSIEVGGIDGKSFVSIPVILEAGYDPL